MNMRDYANKVLADMAESERAAATAATPAQSPVGQPTPRPWYTEGTDITAGHICLVDFVNEADARHIVLCVNAFDDLVAAAKLTVRALKEDVVDDYHAQTVALNATMAALRKAEP